MMASSENSMHESCYGNGETFRSSKLQQRGRKIDNNKENQN